MRESSSNLYFGLPTFPAQEICQLLIFYTFSDIDVEVNLICKQSTIINA